MKRKHLTFKERQTIKNMLDKRESRSDICISEEETLAIDEIITLRIKLILERPNSTGGNKECTGRIKNNL